jgi:hypothetical protein
VPEPQPRSISNRAADDLTYIRSALERSSALSAVPGAGGVVTGVIGLIATSLDRLLHDRMRLGIVSALAAAGDLSLSLDAIIRATRSS